MTPTADLMEIRQTRAPFTMLPNALIDADLSAHAKIVYLGLARFANTDRACWPSQATIARRIGLGLTTVKAALGELIRAGWLAVRQAAGRATTYLLRWEASPHSVGDLAATRRGTPPTQPPHGEVTQPRGDHEVDVLPGTRPISNEQDPVTPSGALKPAPAKDAWDGYSEAYQQRYSVAPVRNAKVNGMLARFRGRVPAAEAAAIAGFYLQHNAATYVRAGHPVDLLLRDAEKLRTEWITNQRISETQARHADETQSRGDQARRLIARYDREDAEAQARGARP